MNPTAVENVMRIVGQRRGTAKERKAAAEAVHEARVLAAVRLGGLPNEVDDVLHALEMAYWKLADEAAPKKKPTVTRPRGKR
jgi:hypothetical protein